MINFLKKYFTFNNRNGYQPVQTKNCIVGILVLMLLFNTGFQIINCYLLRQNNITANLNTLNIITEINKIRVNYGLDPLVENPKLDIAALLKAQDMIEKDYFNHYSPEGKAPWDWIASAKYDYKYAGENLALNFFNDQETVQAWLNSPSHKENILNPNYKETGVAILSGSTSTTKESRTVVVQMFGAEKQIVAKPQAFTTTTKPLIQTTVSTTLKTTTTINTTTTKVDIAESKMINATESVDVKKKNEVTLITNIAPIIKQQSENANKELALGLQLVSEVVKPSTIKIVNNSFGLGLLFLGIFGIINISSENSISNSFKRKLFLKNAFVLIIALGFLLNNMTRIIYQIKIPTI